MANVDLSKLKEKYSNFEMKPQKDKDLKKKGHGNTTIAKRKFLNKLSEGMFSEFTSGDWIFYFQRKYEKTNGRTYPINGQKAWMIEHAIYKSVMKDYTPKDVKLMIDFVFDSSQDIKPKLQLGSYIFSKGWLQGVYQSSMLWQTGDYMNQAEANKAKYAPDKRNREWQGTKDEEVKIIPKRRIKGSITF